MAIEVRYTKNLRYFTKNYSYLVFDTDSRDGVIIDPAWDLNALKSLISANDVNPSKILLTHHHHDHVNLVDVLSEEFGLPVLMNKAEIEFYSFNCPNLCEIDEYRYIPIGQSEVVPIHTPGHTKGSTSYLIGDNLFTGDTLFIEGCGLCVGSGADPNEMFDSVQRIKSMAESQMLIYPGHSYGKDPGKSFDFVFQNNIYLQLENRDHFVRFRMRGDQQKILDFV